MLLISIELKETFLAITAVETAQRLCRFIIWNLISLLAVVLIYQELIQPRFLAGHLGSVSSVFYIE